MRAVDMRRAAAALATAILIVLFALFGAAPEKGRAAPTEGRVALVERIIDGDTFVVAGGDRIRVRNFDTPELRRYDCDAEKALAIAARAAAAELLQDRTVTLDVAYSNRYDRLVADVLVHEGGARIDFVAAMVAGGHGARWAYGEEPQPEWCAPPTASDEIAALGG